VYVYFVGFSETDDEEIALKDLVLFASEKSAQSHLVNLQYESKMEHNHREDRRREYYNEMVDVWETPSFPVITPFQREEWRPLNLVIRSLWVW
jgi:hypothetical protein